MNSSDNANPLIENNLWIWKQNCFQKASWTKKMLQFCKFDEFILQWQNTLISKMSTVLQNGRFSKLKPNFCLHYKQLQLSQHCLLQLPGLSNKNIDLYAEPFQRISLPLKKIALLCCFFNCEIVHSLSISVFFSLVDVDLWKVHIKVECKFWDCLQTHEFKKED